MGRVGMAIGVLAAGLVLVAPGPATAHVKKYNSRVTIQHPSEPNWEGDVFSGSKACVRLRGVQLWVEGPGADDSLLGEFNADRRGHWSYGIIGDRYYARVKREVVRSRNGHRHICKADRSATVD